MLQAAVLAAGESRRMGSPKALLPDRQGVPFITRIIQTLRSAHLTDVLVITGSQHEGIAAAVAQAHLDSAVRFARNPDPTRGQLSSIWTALDSSPDDTDGLLMTLVDVPMITTATVRAVIDAWNTTRAPVVRPIVDGRRGHPVIFDRRIFDELRAAPLDTGARLVVRAHWGESVDVPVADRGSIVDIDTPAEYERLRNEYTSDL